MPAKRSRRTAIAALSLGAHAALLATFVLRPAPPPMAAGVGTAISVALVAAPPGPEVAEAPSAEPAPPAAEPQAVEVAAEASVAAAELAQPAPAEPSLAPAAAAGGGSDLTGCALTDAVHAALRAEAPRAALARIPERRRSVAGAVMLWDGGWIRSGALADARVARPIRTAIAEAVRAAEPACAAAPVSGPVLLLVPDQAGAMVLVLGSGIWRWADLTTEREASHPTAAGGR